MTRDQPTRQIARAMRQERIKASVKKEHNDITTNIHQQGINHERQKERDHRMLPTLLLPVIEFVHVEIDYEEVTHNLVPLSKLNMYINQH